MRDVDSDIRSSLERLTSTTCDTSNVDVLWSDLAVRRRKRRARKGALVAVPLVLVAALAAGVLVDESRREVRTGVAAGGSGDIDADDEAPAVETTSPDAEPEGYTAAQADRWFDELRNVGILQDDSFASDQLRERLRAGQVLVTGTVSGVPSLVRQEMTLPGLEYTGTDELGENGEPASLPTGHRLVLPLTVEGSVEGFALQFELGVDAPGSGHAELVASLAPPPGTRMLFVGDSSGVATLGTGVVVGLRDGSFRVGGNTAGDGTSVEGLVTFEALITMLQSGDSAGHVSESEREPASEEAGGGTDATPTVPPTDQTKEVAYNGIRFDVPSRLPVSEPSPYDFHCRTYEEDGVFLAPPGSERMGASCPVTDDYAETIHVQQLVSQDPGDRNVEGVGPNERWIAEHEANRWHEAALPAYGVLFTFYEVDTATREAVLSSVRNG